MSSDDDRLAPVTPLFGQRHREEPAADSRSGSSLTHPAGSGRGESSSAQASGGWAEAGPGPDETRDAEASPHGENGPTEAGEASPARPALRALPTYAEFAARSEPVLADEHNSDAAAEEPAETLEAARVRAENISMHALSRRGVSSHEMTNILRSRDLPDEVVESEIARLEGVGLLDDAELAENLVRSKQERKGLGKSAISNELRQRGVAQEAIEAAIADIDDDDEQARCDEWAAKRVGQLRGLDHATAERRLNGYLMRRGYRSEVIRRSIEKALPRGGGNGGGGVRFR
ncbi:regulatory protein RecX [Frondihabitans cladoniiphilus]|uniref:Regulatory protein RecX n=1 Tax=Frondihabitans cladoniiphilus TaxID=715785 RepID=A0ABP8VQT3_9MICO